MHRWLPSVSLVFAVMLLALPLAAQVSGASSALEAELSLEAREAVLSAEEAIPEIRRLLDEDGSEQAAVDLGRETLEKLAEAVPESHPVAIKVRTLVGMGLAGSRQLQPGLETLEEVVPLHEATFGWDDPDTAEANIRLVDSYRDLGRNDDAMALIDQIIEKLSQEDPGGSSRLAKAFFSRGTVAYRMGKVELMGQSLKEALGMYESLENIEKADYANTLRIYGLSLELQGDCLEAEKLYRQVLGILAEEEGAFATAAAYNSLASALSCLNDYHGAVEFLRKGVEVMEELFGKGSFRAASVKINLAFHLDWIERFEEAEALHKEVIAEIRQTVGEDHRLYAMAINNYGANLHGMHRNEEALPLLEKAFELRKKSLGLEHPRTWHTAANLAGAMSELGQKDQGEELLREAVEFLVGVHGPKHPQLVKGYNGLARILPVQQDNTEAMDFALRALEILQTTAKLSFQTLPEERKVLWMESKSENFDIPLGLLAEGAGHTDEQVRQTWEFQIFRKNLTLRLLAGQRGALQSLGDDELLQTYETMLHDKEKHTRLLYQPPRGLAPEQLEAERKATQARIQEAEEVISRQWVSYAVQQDSLRVTLEEVLEEIPEGAVLIDFYRYKGHAFSDRAPRYCAFVATRHEVRFVDLGLAKQIDFGVEVVRELLKPDAAPLDQTAIEVLRKLHDLLIEPLALPAETEQLILVPDSALHLLPFDILLDGDTWMIDQYRLQLLSNGADLVPFDGEAPQQAGPDAVIVDPSFDGALSNRQILDSLKEEAQALASATLSVAGLRSAGCAAIDDLPHMAALPGSRKEGRSIRRRLRRSNDVVFLTDTDATVASLLRVEDPRVLHVATHGFFLQGCGDAEQDVNSLLLSGLAMAGANKPESFGESAFLTAYQASQMNLQNTALVVLSACDTGTGVIRGDGLHGLRRAFEIAGASTVVTSLWPVPDRETAELMDAYYARLASGETTVQALQEAKRELRATIERRYGADLPAYWAGFVAVGDDRSLPGTQSQR